MNCPRTKRDIALAVEGDLPPARQARLAAHLAACPDCRAFAQGLRESQAALKRVNFDCASPAEYQAMRQQVLGRLRETQRPRALWKPALAAAAILLVMALLPWLIAGDTEPHPEGPPTALLTGVTTAPPANHELDLTGPAGKTGHPDVVIKLLTDNPNVVIFLLTNGNDKEDSNHASTV